MYKSSLNIEQNSSFETYYDTEGKEASLSSLPLKKQPIVPFLKWAGGKRWLVSKHAELLNLEHNRYIEPFLGSGSVFFHIQPEKAILSDLNENLIGVYSAIKMDWEKVVEELKKHHKKHCKDYYYKIRASKPRTLFTKAARFIYLNRTCWNGLYRVNLKGEFNVPIGTKKDVLYETDDFKEISELLKDVELLPLDFEAVLNRATAGDFVFADPPYTVCHNNNGFLKYNETIFSWNDQLRLRNATFEANKRGAKVLILNAGHDSIRHLYKGFGCQIELERASVLAGQSKYRKRVSELAIASWL